MTEDSVLLASTSDGRRQIPSLPLRVAVDIINGAEVTGELIRVRQAQSGWMCRVWDSLVGTSHRRDQLILQSLSQTQHHVAEVVGWIQNLNIENLRLFEAVLLKLKESREADSTNRDAQKRLEEMINEVQSRVEDHESRIKSLEAHKQVDVVMSQWESGAFDDFPVLTQLFVVMSELAWGEFGQALERDATASDRIKLHQYAMNKIEVHLKRLSASPSMPIDWYLKCFGNIYLPPDTIEQLRFMSESARSPSIWVAAAILIPGASKHEHLPGFPTPRTCVKRLFSEVIANSSEL